MGPTYDEAAAALYRAPFAAFVAERKRLAAELKAAGDKAGALRLGKLARPSLAVWAVNQLWWTAPQEFAELFAAAQRLREGDLGAGEARRGALGKLRARAATLLGEANQAASEVTLRRIATTLAALAAAGFAPDTPGQLAGDRDPPGFESVADMEVPLARPPLEARGREKQAAPRSPESEDLPHRHDDELARARARAVERRRVEEQRAQRRAERERLERSLRSARSEIERRTREIERMRTELTHAESELERSRTTALKLEARLADLAGEQG